MKHWWIPLLLAVTAVSAEPEPAPVPEDFALGVTTLGWMAWRLFRQLDGSGPAAPEGRQLVMRNRSIAAYALRRLPEKLIPDCAG